MTAPALVIASPDERPDTRASFLIDQDAAMEQSRDFHSGTEAVVKQRTKYNPQGVHESDDAYGKKLALSVVDGAYKAVVETAVGLPFAKEPQLSTDTPQVIKDLWENYDGKGTHGVVYWQERMTDAIVDGFSISVDDFTPVVATNAREEAELGARPFASAYKKKDLLDAWTATIGGITSLAGVRLKESYTVQVNRFQRETRDQVRMIWRDLKSGEVLYEVFRDVNGLGVWESYESGFMRGKGGAQLKRFPVRILYGTRAVDPFESDPTFMDVCELARAHYQTWSDRRMGIRLGCNPQPVFTGADIDTVKAAYGGASLALVLPEKATFSYQAAPSDMMLPALEELRQIEARIAAISFAHIAGTPRSNETAAAKRLDTAATDSTLAALVRRLADCADESLAVNAEYLGVDEGTLGIDRDFRAPVLVEPAMLGVFSQMVERGQLSLATVLTVLKTGRFPDNWDLEDEALSALAGAYRVDESPYSPDAATAARGSDAITDAGSGGA